MTETNESQEHQNEEAPVPVMTTVERAEMLLRQDAAIRAKINDGATLDEAVDPSNKEFGSLAHPEQVQMRVAKRAMMLKEGIAPYPVTLDVTDTIEAVRAKYDGKLEAGDETEDVVGIAGRVLFLRNAGGLCFVQLSAGDGTKIQGMISKKEIGADSLKQFKQLVDLGDHLFIKGRVIASKTGELSVFATEWAIAAKALQPLPALHKDLNEDTRTRKPYIGMIADEKIRNMVRNRSKAVASLRKTFADHDFIEVETPMLQTVHGGAAARPFTTHMNAFDLDLYLRIAPELYLKRLVVGGFERVFEINRNFRNEGVSVRHNPEFTMMEFYCTYWTYLDQMEFTENLLRTVAVEATGSAVIEYQGMTIDLSKPFARLTPFEAIKTYAPHYTDEELQDENFLRAELARLGEPQPEFAGLGALQMALFEETAESKLIQPTFIINFPIEVSPLARASDTDPTMTERFELYIAGRETANGFSELNDPEDQAARFKAQADAKSHGDDEAMYYDADYIRALEYGLPPTGGCGIGIDRFVMLLTNASTIRDVLLFPHMRPETNLAG